MILNASTVLDLALVALRLPIGFLLVAWSVRGWWQARGLFRRERGLAHTAGGTSEIADRREQFERRSYLLLLISSLLVVLNLLAWPLLYAVLQSYIPQWPGVMCIYGVTQIGAGSVGASRYLPMLLVTLELLKPLTVFLSGGWLVAYLVSRRAEGTGNDLRVLALLALFATATILDAACEGAYLLAPKREQFVEAGCCTAPLEAELRSGRFVPQSWSSEHYLPMRAAFVVGNLSWAAGLWCASRRLARFPAGGDRRSWRGRAGWLILACGAFIALPLNGLFFKEIASPQILQLPFHHCLYDLFVEAPESLIGVVLLAGATFAVGWAALLAWTTSTRTVGEWGSKLLVAAAFGYLGCVIHFSVALALV